MKNKIIITGIILITISITFLLKMQIENKIDKEKHNKKIEEIKEIIETKEPTKETSLVSDYIGYIDIPSQNIKRLIKENYSKKILDENYVGTYNMIGTIDNHDNPLILLGHNIENVFKKIKNLEIDDEIYIVTYKNKYKYKVYNKVTINEEDMSYFDDNNKNLILITCTNTKEERLIVIARLESINE